MTTVDHPPLYARVTDECMRVGLIADTHGLLRPEARVFFMGCDYIVHAGDVGSRQILDELATIAPLIAVKGNNDTQPWAARLPETELVRIGHAFVYVVHDLNDLDIDLGAANVSVVISGHSHKPKVAQRAGVLYINPGSCGPQRFKLPVCLGEMMVSDGALSARVVDFSGAVHAATSPVV
jgi:uncharacterized protein